MYTIECDHRRRMLTLVLKGFWSADEARAFVRDEQQAVRRLGPPAGTHLTLADVREFAIQTQEVSTIIRDLVMNGAATSKRIALVVGGEGLARMQSRRIAEREDMQSFTCVKDAEAWLES